MPGSEINKEGAKQYMENGTTIGSIGCSRPEEKARTRGMMSSTIKCRDPTNYPTKISGNKHTMVNNKKCLQVRVPEQKSIPKEKL